MIKPRIFGLFGLTTLLFAAGVVLFFTKAAVFPYKVACPVLCLALSIMLTRRKMLFPFGAAFILSALGDAMGAKGLFLLQITCFALAHVAYMCFFVPRARPTPGIGSLAVVVPLLLFLALCIVPRASVPAERIGVAVYGVVIAGMLYSVLQYRGFCAAGFLCAALLFVFSDSLIAWSRFVGPIPGRTWIVMSTYYPAQYLFYFFAIRTASARRQSNFRLITGG